MGLHLVEPSQHQPGLQAELTQRPQAVLQVQVLLISAGHGLTHLVELKQHAEAANHIQSMLAE
jgi:hypothetical protein